MLAITKVKQEMEFNKRFHSLVDVLKSIAVQQFHALEAKLKLFVSFEHTLQEFFALLDLKHLAHPFLTSNAGPVLAVAVTSDQGMLGGLNHRIAAGAVSMARGDQDEVIIVGEQGKNYARGMGRSFAGFPGIEDQIREAQAKALRNYLFERVMKNGFRTIRVVYARALSLMNQQVEAATLLPLEPLEAGSEAVARQSEMIFESSAGSMLEYLTFLLIGRRLGDIFAFSRIAETAARYVHLEESGQRLDEINKKLRLKYFKLRHEIIDQGMRELFGGRLACGE